MLSRSIGKSITHAHIQNHLKTIIPDLELEKVMGPRRADAVWEERKIVFEIQISPITLDEVVARIEDYRTLGYQVVWLLHDGTFNGRTVYSAERFLRTSATTYYLNGGLFYDQLEVIVGSRRVFKGPALQVEVTKPCAPFIQVPGRAWPLHCVGDVQTICAQEGVVEVEKILKKYLPVRGLKWWVKFAGLRLLELISS